MSGFGGRLHCSMARGLGVYFSLLLGNFLILMATGRRVHLTAELSEGEKLILGEDNFAL